MKTRFIASIIAAVAMLFGGVVAAAPAPAQAADYDPYQVVVMMSPPTCNNGVLESTLNLESLNPTGSGNEMVTAELNGSVLPGFPKIFPAGTNLTVENFIPADTPPGGYVLSFFNQAIFPLLGEPITFTINESCVVVDPDLFEATAGEPYMDEFGLGFAFREVTLSNNGSVNASATILVDGAEVSTDTVIPGTFTTRTVPIPVCQAYNLRVVVSGTDVLNVNGSPFGCAELPTADQFSVVLQAPVCKNGVPYRKASVTNNSSSDWPIELFYGDFDTRQSPVVPAGSTQVYDQQIPVNEPYAAVFLVYVLDGDPVVIYNEDQPAFSCGQPPVLTSGPTVSGTVKVSYTLTCNVAYTGATSSTYKWLRNGVAISGAAARTYKLTASDYNKRMSCASGASNANGSLASKTSPQTGLVALGPALKVVTKPSISGKSSPGKTLTAKVGAWSPAATSYKYRWQVLKAGKWVSISKATGKTYKVSKAYDNKYLRVVVTALKTGYANGAYASARVYI